MDVYDKAFQLKDLTRLSALLLYVMILTATGRVVLQHFCNETEQDPALLNVKRGCCCSSSADMTNTPVDGYTKDERLMELSADSRCPTMWLLHKH